MKFLLFALLFCLPLSAADDVRFLAFGDWGMGNPGQKEVAKAMVDHCAKKRCDFTLGLGDNFYPAGVTSTTDPYWDARYEKCYGELNVPFFASLGNHDYGGNVEAQLNYESPTWRMPGRYYSFIKGPVEFFAIDTNAFNAKQADWLKGQLAKSKAPWKIVYGHHPAYSYGSHGNNPDIIKNVLPLIVNQADFYVTGHDHDQQLLKPDGKTHFVISGAAAENRGIHGGPKAEFVSSELGFAYFKFTEAEARYQAWGTKGQKLFEKTFPAPTRLNRD